jgi:hypothetical protein
VACEGRSFPTKLRRSIDAPPRDYGMLMVHFVESAGTADLLIKFVPPGDA